MPSSITQAGVNCAAPKLRLMHDTRITLSPAPFADFDFRIGRNGDEFRIDGHSWAKRLCFRLLQIGHSRLQSDFRIHPKLVVLTGYTDLALDDISDNNPASIVRRYRRWEKTLPENRHCDSADPLS